VSGLSVRMTQAEAERIGRVRQLAQLGTESVALLIEQLDDSSWVVRRAIVDVLARLGDTPVASLCASLRERRDNESRLAAVTDTLVASTGDVDVAVLELTRDSDPAVVVDAVQILGRRRSKRAIGILARLSEAENDNVAVSAIEALGRIGGKAAVDSLVKAVRSGRFFRAFPAIDVLGRTGDPRAVPPLAELLKEPLYAQEAARALGRTGDPAALEPLVSLLLRPSSMLVRVAAVAIVELLSTYESWYGASTTLDLMVRRHAAAESVRHLLAALPEASPPEQEALCKVLGALGREEALLELAARLDATAKVASAAAQALKKLGRPGETNLLAALRDGNSARRALVLGVLGPRGVEVDDLIACLRDPDGGVRARTCEILGKLGDRRAVAPVFELLGDPNARVSQAAVGALHALGGEVTERLALQAARNGDRRRKRDALRLIGYFGYKSALDVLKATATEEDEQLREVALTSLGFVEDEEALAFLVERARDANVKTRSAAIRALANAELVRVEPILRAALDDPEPWVRYYAAQALGRLHADSAAERLAAMLEDPAGQVRVAAIEALSQLASSLATSALSAGAKSVDLDIRRACLMGLSNARSPELLPVVLDATLDRDAATRLVAVSALAAFDATRAIERLGELAASDADQSVRSAALSALADRPGQEATRALISLLGAPELESRARDALSSPAPGRIDGILAALNIADEELAAMLASCLARMRTPEALLALSSALALPSAVARKAAVITAAAVGTRPLLEALSKRAGNDADPEVGRIIASVLRS
jgi:HEAT repeat protein